MSPLAALLLVVLVFFLCDWKTFFVITGIVVIAFNV